MCFIIKALVYLSCEIEFQPSELIMLTLEFFNYLTLEIVQF